MADGLQVAIVTAVAALALVALVRPYLRRPTGTETGSCPKCASGTSGRPTASAEARPLRVVRLGGPPPGGRGGAMPRETRRPS
jgi:hypothetical protein